MNSFLTYTSNNLLQIKMQKISFIKKSYHKLPKNNFKEAYIWETINLI